MTTPDDPLPWHMEPAVPADPNDPFWRDRDDGAQPATPESREVWLRAMDNVQRAMEDIPPLVVRTWVPGDPTDPSQIQGTFTDDFNRDRHGALGASWEAYTGPHPEEAALYEQMRQRQEAHRPAITRADLERQGLLPPTPITTESMINDDVRRALMGGATPEEVNARLRELGFEYHGTLVGDIVQRREPERVNIDDVYAAVRRVNADEIARIYDVPVEMMGDPRLTDYDRVYADGIVPLEDLPAPAGNRAARRGRPGRCQCGNATDPNVNHSRDRCWGETAAERTARITGQAPVPPDEEIAAMQNAIEQMRVLARNMERHTVDVEFTNETPADRNGDPLSAIRTRPLGAGGGAVGAGGGGGGGYARQSTTWAAGGAAGGGGGGNDTVRASGVGMAGGGGVGTGETLRQRLMRHGVTEATPDLDEGVVDPVAPRPPEYIEPEMAKRAQRHMDAIFGDLDVKSKGELVDLIRDMRADWEALNEIHNRRANRSSWCSEYEERQERHNATFKALKLIGRVRNGPSDEYSGSGL